MTQTTKQLIRRTAGAQIKKRASAYAEQRVQDTAVAKVSATVKTAASTVAGKAVDLADKADEKLELFRKIKRCLAIVLAVYGFFKTVFHELNHLYSFIPKLKNANDKVASMTGVDIASKILP